MRTPTLKMALAAGVLLASAGVAQAWVPELLDDAEKASFGQLADIYKQNAKFVACVVKVAVKCEGKYGVDPAAQECSMATAVMTEPDGSGFAEALAGCEGKLDYSKKSAGTEDDYAAMECPGDSEMALVGNQDYGDLEEWQNSHGPTYAQLDALGILAIALGYADERDTKTIGKDIGELSKYSQGLFKCIGACEADSKGKSGGGALTDSTGQCTTTSEDPAQAACIAGAKGKMESKLGAGGGPYAALIGLIDGALDTAGNSFWNNTEGCDGSPSGAFVDGSSLF